MFSTVDFHSNKLPGAFFCRNNNEFNMKGFENQFVTSTNLYEAISLERMLTAFQFLTLSRCINPQLKMPPGGNLGALVTFTDEENRQRALKVLNENCKFKGRLLTATKCKAHVDPYEKAQVQNHPG